MRPTLVALSLDWRSLTSNSLGALTIVSSVRGTAGDFLLLASIRARPIRNQRSRTLRMRDRGGRRQVSGPTDVAPAFYLHV